MPAPDDRPTAYTDGACSGNPGPGGWAWIRPDGPWAAGPDPDTTNQRMELRAALEAIRAADGPIHVVSDSTYVVHCFRDGWWKGWLARGWTNSAKKPVANRDLWEPLVEEVQTHDVTFEWVKGHAGDEWNDLADRLAVEAATSQRARSGPSTPTEFGDPDEAARPGSPRRDPTGREAPAGHLLVTGGSRLPDSPDSGDARALRRTLREIIEAKRVLHPDLVVLSGLRWGAEQEGARAALEAAVPLVAVLPFPNPAATWPDDPRREFERLVQGAEEVIVLQRAVPTDRTAISGALARRDAWLARHAAEAVVVAAGGDAEAARLARSLTDALGELDVWVIER